MKRYNLLMRSHQELKQLLFDTALLLQQQEAYKAHERSSVVTKLNHSAAFVDRFLSQREEQIVPWIFELEPAVTEIFRVDYKKVRAAMSQLNNSCEAVEVSSSWKSINDCIAYFDQLLLLTLKLITSEEEILNKILWRYFTDQHLMAIEQLMNAHSESVQDNIGFNESRFQFEQSAPALVA